MNKLLVFIKVLIITLSVTSPATANEDPVKIEDWSIYKQGKTVRYIANGTTVYGHQFGFIKNLKRCDSDILWIFWSSYDKNVKKHEGSDALFKFQAGETKFQLNIEYLTAVNYTPKLIVVVFTNFLASEKLLTLLERENKIHASIAYPEELAAKFDIKNDFFSLKGFTKARSKAKEICEKL